jgi:hypothetical protein
MPPGGLTIRRRLPFTSQRKVSIWVISLGARSSAGYGSSGANAPIDGEPVTEDQELPESFLRVLSTGGLCWRGRRWLSVLAVGVFARDGGD